MHRSRLIHPDHRAVVDAIPVTSVARAVVDLADVLTEPQLAAALSESEVLRLFYLAALERAQASMRRCGRPARRMVHGPGWLPPLRRSPGGRS